MDYIRLKWGLIEDLLLLFRPLKQSCSLAQQYPIYYKEMFGNIYVFKANSY